MKVIGQKAKNEYFVNLPSSKSISNRLLIIRYLAESNADIKNLSDSDDTFILQSCLQTIANKDLGNKNPVSFNCKNAGTSTRFLLALLATEQGEWIIDADERMNKRPILPLVEALQELGADIKINSREKPFPIFIKGRQLSANKDLVIENHFSSQTISALLLICSRIENGLRIKLPANQTSMPYIDMTIQLLNKYGASIEKHDNFIVCKKFRPFFSDTEVEIDYSALCFLYSIVCVGQLNNVKIASLPQQSLQGDFMARKYFEKLGLEITQSQNHTILSYDNSKVSKENKLEFDLKDTPDVFPSLAVASFFSGKEIEFKNLASLNLKESARLDNMARELNKMANRCIKTKEEFFISSFQQNKTPFYFDKGKKQLKFSSYNDHRIAMALSVISLIYNEIEIDNTACVEKSWRNYWQDVNDFILLGACESK